jgi:Cof subfamily protein (haloacid dehalogenase superfamily)
LAKEAAELSVKLTPVRGGVPEPVAETPLYICDLDGTLLRSDGTLSDFAREGLCQVLDAGVRFTVASARGAPAMRALLAGVPLDLPVIELNGAFVSEFDSGRHMVANTLSATEACAAIEAILETGVDPVLTSWDGERDRVHFGALADDSTHFYVTEKQSYGDPRLTPCEDMLAVGHREEVAQITTFARDAEAPALTRRLAEIVGSGAAVHSQSNTYRPGWIEILIQHPLAQKGAAIPALLEACGSAGDASVIACGDHLNDLGMFEAAASSIAPSNAHPNVRAHATEVVASNDEDGIVRHLLSRHVG